ncbi:cobalt-factor II C(20)-methyltransferase [Methanothrix harundinacea]|uniref:Uroporphyrin-III C/tetrapyrrole methyltransferase n=1 Tax=Methanothrix harundinacea (strain 6Ac) TaxID=1110509 RepID=G7WL51_METH6|nr:cobalt-factor II C(20)-methyltransferase [Methanothrix harundinacea]AET63605.1 Uroporphyrin-III C/tetrapyrrole methyltransferase [Methanothrix harundinacea 6Ac]
MLIGVSLGPGDPELITRKAERALAAADKVFVPGEMAADLVRRYAEPELLDFPMISDKRRLLEIWAENADRVASWAAGGAAAFACIGDVNTFSTFSHLKRLVIERHPEVEIETIPGVGTVPALAARLGVDLSESFLVSDGSPVNTVIRMKAVRPAEMAKELAAEGFDEFLLGVRLYAPDEVVVRGEMPEKSDYFSVLCARRRR